MNPSPFMQTLRQRTEQALASGDLSPLQTQETAIEDGGLRFVLRWAAALAAKDAAAPKPDKLVLPGGPRDPDFNPFLNPDPALTIGPMGDEHTIILNKFPVCLQHLVLARHEFAEQRSPLEASDFAVLAQLLSGEGGLGFYNGGPEAGASQRHKHVQWLPPAPGHASLQQLAAGLPANASKGALQRHPALPFAHVFVRVPVGPGADVAAGTAALLAGFEQALQALGLQPDADGLLPPFNLLAGDGWLLMVPRTREHFEGVSLNALSFGGTLYVRQPEQVDLIRAVGPLQALASVAVAA